MIVPDLKGVSQALQSFFNTTSGDFGATSQAPLTSTPLTSLETIRSDGRRRGSFGRGDVILQAASRAAAAASAQDVKNTAFASDAVEKRQTCPNGYTFYSCDNGFSGCCDDNPCIRNAQCQSIATSTFNALSGTTATTTPFQFVSETSRSGSTTTTQATSRTGIPGNANTTSMESQTGSSTSTAATPATSAAATGSATSTAAPSNRPGGTNVGAIAGGVVGGIAAIALILALLALFFRRQRRKVDERHRKEAMTPGRPILPKDEYFDGFYATGDASALNRNHHRSGSTANDVYLPQGGSYYAPQHTRQRSIYRDVDHVEWV